MTVRCPRCRGQVTHPAPEFPFCGERCRLLDLGAWASEEYRVPDHAPAIEFQPQANHDE
ncbi:MAG: DNA gyrase inhibitor YacG [Acidobacteria bacterium]|nr:DNA gyrase inhibitor YacG [Acidobacteriota bacterium]